MYAAEMHVPADELRVTLTRTRQWFERRCIEPKAFRYRLTEPTVFVTIAFRLAKEASDFVDAFGGEILPMEPV